MSDEICLPPIPKSIFFPGTKNLKPQFIGALKHIFKICDRDNDGALNDKEFKYFQDTGFDQMLTPSQIQSLKKTLQEKMSEGVAEYGVTLSGFFLLHALFVTKGKFSTIWKILKRFGYNDDLVLKTNRIIVSTDQVTDADLQLFNFTLKAVDYPPAPLYDRQTQTLKPRCERALKRIFALCDQDKDGALNDAEMKGLQEKCFRGPPQTSELESLKRLLHRDLPEGINDRGFTLAGFLFTHKIHIQEGYTESTWAVLWGFGYDDDIKLRDDLISVSLERAPDQTVELTNEAILFLKRIFSSFDHDVDGTLKPAELDDLFCTTPESPWDKPPYRFAAETTASGGLSLDGFLSKWSLMTLLEPAKSLANLIYIGYPGDSTSAFRITRRRQEDRKKQQSERNVFQCFVFGPRNSGKSELLKSFLGRPYGSITSERFAANVISGPNGTTKTLILREIPEQGLKPLLSSKESLAACDVAIFVHDSSDEHMWKRAEEMLFDVASHGERSAGFEVPCLIVAAKNDMMCPYATAALQDSVGVHSSLRIEKPICISTKLGDVNHIFHRIINAAEHPHLNIPETEAGRTRKFYRQFVSYSLVILSVGVGVRLGIAYASRKNTST